MAITVACVLLTAGALALTPTNVPSRLSPRSALWAGWWFAAITSLRASAALGLAHTGRHRSGPSQASRWSLRLAPRFVRPLVLAALWAGLQAPPANAQDPTEPAVEHAIMRRIDKDPAVGPAPTEPGTSTLPSPAPPPEPTSTDPPAAPDTVATSATVIAEPGDHLWRLAADALAAHLGRQPRLIELNEYWLRVIDTNRDHLTSGDPNLIYSGESIRLPAVAQAAP